MIKKCGIKISLLLIITFYTFQMNEKLNEIMRNHQSVMSEKDRQIIEYQKQIEKLQKIESDLSVQIEEQKVKNNVSDKPSNFRSDNKIFALIS